MTTLPLIVSKKTSPRRTASLDFPRYAAPLQEWGAPGEIFFNIVDWISFNIEDLRSSPYIALRLMVLLPRLELSEGTLHKRHSKKPPNWRSGTKKLCESHNQFWPLV